jgi:hypothetical protein
MNTRQDVVTYYNGRRYMRRTQRHVDLWTAARYATRITFAYSGVANGWPVIISYTIA